MSNCDLFQLPDGLRLEIGSPMRGQGGKLPSALVSVRCTRDWGMFRCPCLAFSDTRLVKTAFIEGRERGRISSADGDGDGGGASLEWRRRVASCELRWLASWGGAPTAAKRASRSASPPNERAAATTKPRRTHFFRLIRIASPARCLCRRLS